MSDSEVQARPLDFEVEPVHSSGSLLDAVDKLMDKGASLKGQVLLTIADVDLVMLDLRLLLTAVETVEQSLVRAGRRSPPPATAPAGVARPAIAPPAPPLALAGDVPAAAPAPAPAGEPASRLALDPDAAEKGLARLVLTLVEFLRRLLERQAVRRMEGGLLPEESIERMGVALERLEAKVLEMKGIFGLEGEELDLDLGPLGRLTGPSEGTDQEPPRG